MHGCGEGDWRESARERRRPCPTLGLVHQDAYWRTQDRYRRVWRRSHAGWFKSLGVGVCWSSSMTCNDYNIFYHIYIYIYLLFFSSNYNMILHWKIFFKHIHAQWLNWTLTFFTSQHVTPYLRTLSLTSATQTKWRSVGTALCIGKSLRGLMDAGLILASSGTRFTPPPPI